MRFSIGPTPTLRNTTLQPARLAAIHHLNRSYGRFQGRTEVVQHTGADYDELIDFPQPTRSSYPEINLSQRSFRCPGDDIEHSTGIWLAESDPAVSNGNAAMPYCFLAKEGFPHTQVMCAVG